jgi:hypothetical protein
MLTYILGNGGYANELYDQFLRDSLFGGFITLHNDKCFVTNESGVEIFDYPKNAVFILGTGSKKWRSAFLSHFSEHYPLTDKYFPNFIHEKAYKSSISTLGIGNVIGPFATINGNASLDNFNCLNIYSSISHDCTVGSYNIFSPYSCVLGYCTIGTNNFFGANCIVTPRLKLGNNNTISAGECLFEDMGYKEFFKSGIVTKKP